MSCSHPEHIGASVCCPVSLLRCYSPHSLLAPLMSRPQLKPVIICCGASWALSRPRLGTKDMARGKKKKERPLEWWKCTELMQGWWTKNAQKIKNLQVNWSRRGTSTSLQQFWFIETSSVILLLNADSTDGDDKLAPQLSKVKGK